jgi:hypothetical protein
MDQGPTYETLNSEITTGRSRKHSGTNRYKAKTSSIEAQQLRESTDKWNFIKSKNFCTSKEMVSKLKRPPTEL